MNKALALLNNRYLVAVVVGLFLLSLARSFSRR